MSTEYSKGYRAALGEVLKVIHDKQVKITHSYGKPPDALTAIYDIQQKVIKIELDMIDLDNLDRKKRNA